MTPRRFLRRGRSWCRSERWRVRWTRRARSYDEAWDLPRWKPCPHDNPASLGRAVLLERPDVAVAGGDERLVLRRLDQLEVEPARQDRPAGTERDRRDVGDHLVEQP